MDFTDFAVDKPVEFHYGAFDELDEVHNHERLSVAVVAEVQEVGDGVAGVEIDPVSAVPVAYPYCFGLNIIACVETDFDHGLGGFHAVFCLVVLAG